MPRRSPVKMKGRAAGKTTRTPQMLGFQAEGAAPLVHGKPVTLHLEKLWDRNVTLTTRLVDTVTTPMLLKIVQSGKLQPGKLITHRFALADVMKAYDTFGNAAKEGALKVILKNQREA